MAVVPMFFITTDYMLEETLSVLFPKSKDILKIKLAEYAAQKRMSASNVNVIATTGTISNITGKNKEEPGISMRPTSLSSL